MFSLRASRRGHMEAWRLGGWEAWRFGGLLEACCGGGGGRFRDRWSLGWSVHGVVGRSVGFGGSLVGRSMGSLVAWLVCSGSLVVAVICGHLVGRIMGSFVDEFVIKTLPVCSLVGRLARLRHRGACHQPAERNPWGGVGEGLLSWFLGIQKRRLGRKTWKKD